MAFLAVVLLAVSAGELLALLGFVRPYYARGPLPYRVQWQSGATVEEAQQAVEGVEWAAEWTIRRIDNEVLQRRSVPWFDASRTFFRFTASPQGAIVQCEVRPFASTPLLIVAAIVTVAAGISILIWFPALLGATAQIVAYACGAHRTAVRSAQLRDALRGIGARLCMNCGYDLHGLPADRICPECGRAEPEFLAPDAATIEQVLARKIRTRRWGARTAIVVGGALTLVAPIALGTAFWLAVGRVYAWYPWLWFFAGVALVTIPVMFWTVHRGTFEPLTSPDVRDMPYSARRAASPLLFASAATSIMLVGPELVLSGLGLIPARDVAPETVRSAAQIVERLLASNHGKSLRTLQNPSESPAEFRIAVEFLITCGWIGQTADRDVIYLLSATRRRFRPSRETR